MTAIFRTWFDLGVAHYAMRRPCDERYPLDYQNGYAKAIGIKFEVYKLPYYGRKEDFVGYKWQADCGSNLGCGNTQSQAIARLCNNNVKALQAVQ